MFATDADDAAVPAGAAVTHGRHSRWPLKVATQGRHSRSPLKVATQGRHPSLGPGIGPLAYLYIYTHFTKTY